MGVNLEDNIVKVILIEIHTLFCTKSNENNMKFSTVSARHVLSLVTRIYQYGDLSFT